MSPQEASQRAVAAQRLEGSRFGACRTTSLYSFERFIRPKNVATSGSRELPNAMRRPLALDSSISRP
jgi:hypothetical protein